MFYDQIDVTSKNDWTRDLHAAKTHITWSQPHPIRLATYTKSNSPSDGRYSSGIKFDGYHKYGGERCLWLSFYGHGEESFSPVRVTVARALEIIECAHNGYEGFSAMVYIIGPSRAFQAAAGIHEFEYIKRTSKGGTIDKSDYINT